MIVGFLVSIKTYKSVYLNYYANNIFFNENNCLKVGRGRFLVFLKEQQIKKNQSRTLSKVGVI